mmetsp:Transcript_13668/g.38709  ORF Transcript_13668/g.38709 Transcript_13668/m.38709 type:complete len:84 (+) Transcript_13668:130-381(+)|eukprot:CAMPEP_0117677090 /NCGR_PEP_ID=MMETSP0804-20121206/16556_1 /TAXON_ID=1074897 /ORGANISM="Tetraselmis astigmatica, Strain CCMP880" /LENGTH=83 /DNA_ID=CAMNT_0005486343 /DNA_START=189 /DNA_END=440 /DNA_ORIENTATION=-
MDQPQADAGAGGNPQNSADLTKFVQNLLNQMQTRFQTMSDSIIGRIDEMGGRIDELEKSIGDLIQQAGVEDEKHGAPPAIDQK